MSKPIKEMITAALATRFADEQNAVWVELIGLDGVSTNEFRRALRGRHMRLEVVKTSLLKRACTGKPMARLAEHVDGPVALVTGGESAVDMGKLLDEWLPKLPKNLRVRGALLEGEYLDETAVKDLKSMPTRADLQARIVQLVLTPGGNIVSTILGPGARLAGVLKALIEKLEEGEPVGAQPAPAAAAVESAPPPEAAPLPEAAAAPEAVSSPEVAPAPESAIASEAAPAPGSVVAPDAVSPREAAAVPEAAVAPEAAPTEAAAAPETPVAEASPPAESDAAPGAGQSKAETASSE